MSIQKRIDSLQPYVIQIRIVNGSTVVDTVFKDGWKVPTSKVINTVKGDDPQANYFMIYTEVEDLGLDDIFDYIEKVIEINIEREKKYELLKVKTEELKELFKTNSLSKLENMKFVFDDKLIPEIMTSDFDEEIQISDVDIEEKKVEDISKPVEHEIKSEKIDDVDSEIRNFNNIDVELPQKKNKIVVEEYPEPKIICNCDDGQACPLCTDM